MSEEASPEDLAETINIVLETAKELRTFEMRHADSELAIDLQELPGGDPVWAKVQELGRYSTILQGTPEGDYLEAIVDHFGGSSRSERIGAFLDQPVKALEGLSRRTYTSLERWGGDKKIGHLARLTPYQLRTIVKGMGKVGAEQIVDALREQGIEAGSIDYPPEKS